jgi:hypothetical protein
MLLKAARVFLAQSSMLVTMVVMVVIVVMIMVMIMGMIVVMVVVGVVVILVRVGIEHLGANRRLRHLGELEDVVHHLVLEDRRPELGEELRVAAVIVIDLTLLPWKLPDALEQRTAHLVVGDGDLTAPTHLRQD